MAESRSYNLTEVTEQMGTIQQQAAANFDALSRNRYPGRGLAEGGTPDGSIAQIYWLMGRSESSRNRVLEEIPELHGWVRTRIADTSEFTGDPKLLIYTAMAENLTDFVVSNGEQTDDVIKNGIAVLEGEKWEYEPDEPNYTPRITGLIHCEQGDDPYMRMVMLRKSPSSMKCDCMSFPVAEITPGLGYYFSTYKGDGDPLPSFQGEPRIVPIGSDDPYEIGKTYWDALNPENRVALAVKLIRPGQPSVIKLFNRHRAA